jgi:hypothetical protein
MQCDEQVLDSLLGPFISHCLYRLVGGRHVMCRIKVFNFSYWLAQPGRGSVTMRRSWSRGFSIPDGRTTRSQIPIIQSHNLTKSETLHNRPEVGVPSLLFKREVNLTYLPRQVGFRPEIQGSEILHPLFLKFPKLPMAKIWPLICSRSRQIPARLHGP